ncbi:MAG TPA: glycoside hydrolase [Candidatus Hungatella pullicola]|nr:glycoside hydrolase [Candidatus Hungatella pullicola]
MKHKRLACRLTAAALCAVLGIGGSVGLYPAFTAYAANYEKVDGYYQMPDGTILYDAIARGIDVSRWQGNIDWEQVAANDVEFVMIGTRSRGSVDPYFHANVQGASEAGIKVGAYIYSLATTPEMAREEADFVLNLVKDYPISFPIAFDAEDSGTLGTLSPQQVSEVINAFCEKIEEAGYYPIVYANDNWLANKIDLSTMHYDVWVARYGKLHTYSDPIMWQATSSGSVGGINGNVDIDFLYEDLTPYLPANLWRTIDGQTFYYQNYEIQKDTWINDGTGWFYMDSNGLSSKGWLEKNDAVYYLEESTGRMVTGWQLMNSNWYFFNDSGSMATGWLDLNGTRYHLNTEGVMDTGWLLQPEGYYYLETDSGAMARGWKQVNGKWYFLQDTGVMVTGWLDSNGQRYFLHNDGSMATGWHEENNSKYYLTDSGAAAAGWLLLDNTWYYFNSDYTMATGWVNPDGNWYYLNSNGQMQTGWLDLNGTWYYLSTSSGKMTTGWRQVDGYWYYFNESGAMVTGLTEINGQLYYLNTTDGRMAVSTTLDFDGVIYTADENGVCTKVEEQVPDTEGQSTGEQSQPAQDTGSQSTENNSGQTGNSGSSVNQSSSEDIAVPSDAPSSTGSAQAQQTSPAQETQEIGPGIGL